MREQIQKPLNQQDVAGSRLWQAVFFDFDGVIADSNQVKSEAFATLFAPYGPSVQQEAVAYHRANGGMPRIHKLQHCMEQIAGQSCEPTRLAQLVHTFAMLIFTGVMAAPLLPGVLPALRRLEEYQVPAYIVSGAPEDEIRRVARGRGLGRYFAGIHGSPRWKSDILRDLLTRHSYTPEHCLFIGDAMADYQAAQETGLHFLGIVQPGALSRFPDEVRIVPSLRSDDGVDVAFQPKP